VYSLDELGVSFGKSDPMRFYWLGKAAEKGDLFSFLAHYREQVTIFASGGGSPSAVFAIGSVLKKHLNLKEKQIFGSGFNFDELVGPALKAIQFYEAQSKAAKAAIDTFSMIAFRNGLVKDMRLMIAKMVWDARIESSYKL